MSLSTNSISKQGFIGLALSLFSIVALFSYNATNGLWIDESATWWVATSEYVDVIRDTSPYPNHVLYYGLMKIWVRAFGDSEVSLRLPSLLSALLTGLGCVRIGAALFPRISVTALWVFVPVYLFQPEAVWSMSTAKPYAFCNLLASLTALAAVEYCSEGRKKWLALLYLYTVATLITHPILITLLPILCIGASILDSPRREENLLFVALSLIAGALTAGLLSLITGNLSLTNRLNSAYGLTSPSIAMGTWLNMYPTTTAMFTFMIIGLVVIKIRRGLEEPFPLRSSSLLFLAVWAGLPAFILVLGVALTGYNILVPRYVWHSMIAWSALAAALVSYLWNKDKKLGVICLLCFPFIGSVKAAYLPKEDWRGAVEAACSKHSPHTKLVYVRSGHPESTLDRWLATDQLRSGWSAPATYYCRTQRVLPFPPLMDAVPGTEVSVRIVSDDLAKADEVSAVISCTEEHGCPEIEIPFSRTLSQEGFALSKSHSFQGVRTLIFNRTQ